MDIVLSIVKILIAAVIASLVYRNSEDTKKAKLISIFVFVGVYAVVLYLFNLFHL